MLTNASDAYQRDINIGMEALGEPDQINQKPMAGRIYVDCGGAGGL